MAGKELTRVLDLVLSVPGENKPIRCSFQVTRKQLMVMCLLLESGVQLEKERAAKSGDSASQGVLAEIQALVPEVLKTGGPGLLEFYEKLKQV